MGLAKELRKRREVKVREVVVPEWGDDSGAFKLYCRPITCYDMNQLQKKHPNFLTNTTIAAMVDLIVMKAEDKSGENIVFPNGEFPKDRFLILKPSNSHETHFLSVLLGIEGSLSKHEWRFLGYYLKIVVGVMPEKLHVVPGCDDSVFVFELENCRWRKT